MSFARLVEVDGVKDRSINSNEDNPSMLLDRDISNTRASGRFKRRGDFEENDDLSRFKRIRVISVGIAERPVPLFPPSDMTTGDLFHVDINKHETNGSEDLEVVPGKDTSLLLNCHRIWYVFPFLLPPI